jgi:alkylation response protein AidB-like acyl-CoA dehydrogenase
MAQTATADDAEFRGAVRGFLAKTSPESQVRRLIDDDLGYDPAVWRRLAAELGIQGLLIPEVYGGQELTAGELVVVLEETGRALLCAPLLASAVLATQALLEAADDAAAKRYLPPLADGSTIATLALDDMAGTRTTAVEADGGWLLDGAKTRVSDAQAADLLLVVADAGGEAGLFALPTDAPGLELTRLDTLDLTRRQYAARLRRTPASRVGGRYDAAAGRLAAFGAIAAAAEQVGVAARTLEIAVDYARTREQFGRPIGSFQAVKHLCAEMFVLAECARAAVTDAATATVETPEQWLQAAAVAKVYCSMAATTNAENLIQILGGIGYTWEHVAHLYLRRAKTLEFLFGDPATQRATLALHLGLTPTP